MRVRIPVCVSLHGQNSLTLNSRLLCHILATRTKQVMLRLQIQFPHLLNGMNKSTSLIGLA